MPACAGTRHYNPPKVRLPVSLGAQIFRLTPGQLLSPRNPPPTSAFRVLHMNTCYYYQDLLPGPVHAPAKERFNPASGIQPIRLTPWMRPRLHTGRCFETEVRPGMAPPFGPRPFSGLPHSAGELLRTP